MCRDLRDYRTKRCNINADLHPRKFVLGLTKSRGHGNPHALGMFNHVQLQLQASAPVRACRVRQWVSNTSEDVCSTSNVRGIAHCWTTWRCTYQSLAYGHRCVGRTDEPVPICSSFFDGRVRLASEVAPTQGPWDSLMLTPARARRVVSSVAAARKPRGWSLSTLRVAHADSLFELFSDPAVAHATSDAPHASVEVTRNHIGGLLKRHDQRAGISWALVVKGEDSAVGQVAVHSISWANRRADLGFDLVSRLWRRGLMSEALRATIRFCFAHLRFIKLCRSEHD